MIRPEYSLVSCLPPQQPQRRLTGLWLRTSCWRNQRDLPAPPHMWTRPTTTLHCKENTTARWRLTEEVLLKSSGCRSSRGDNDFYAVEYHGGLPGRGWYGGPQNQLRGRREGGRLELYGEGHRYVLANGVAWVADSRTTIPNWIDKVNRVSRTLGEAPPGNAIVLFDGKKTNAFDNASLSPEGYLKEGAVTKDAYRDYYLHVEFQTSYMPDARGQGRSNSGIYLQKRYEVQILDSFGLEGKSNECGGIYHYRRPDINMSLPPLTWQTYDIDFRSPRFDYEGRKVENARISLWHNGYLVQNDAEVSRSTGHGAPESAEPLPILLQNHGNPVRFRNIWLVVNPPTAVGHFAAWPPIGAVFVTPPHHDYWIW